MTHGYVRRAGNPANYLTRDKAPTGLWSGRRLCAWLRPGHC